jgi:hypothetical protein
MSGCAPSMPRFRSASHNPFDIRRRSLTLNQESITFEHEHEAKSYTELFTNRYVAILSPVWITYLHPTQTVPLSGVSSLPVRSKRVFR